MSVKPETVVPKKHSKTNISSGATSEARKKNIETVNACTLEEKVYIACQLTATNLLDPMLYGRPAETSDSVAPKALLRLLLLSTRLAVSTS